MQTGCTQQPPFFTAVFFFTLTTGAGLSIAAFAAAWVWDRVFDRKIGFLIPAVALWTALLVVNNWGGFSLLTSLYFTLIPPVVFWTACKWMSEKSGSQPWRTGLIHTVPLLILALLWSSQLDSRLFSHIRDRLLKSCAPGEKIIDFYYRYTFFPAEAIKPLSEKRFKSFVIDAQLNDPIKERLKDRLAFFGWQWVKTPQKADLTINVNNDYLILRTSKAFLETPVSTFLISTGSALNQISEKSDTLFFFRKFTFYSLLLAFPIILYVMVHAILYLILNPFLGQKRASGISTGFCFFFRTFHPGSLHFTLMFKCRHNPV